MEYYYTMVRCANRAFCATTEVVPEGYSLTFFFNNFKDIVQFIPCETKEAADALTASINQKWASRGLYVDSDNVL